MNGRSIPRDTVKALTALPVSWDASGSQWAGGDRSGAGKIGCLDLTALAGSLDASANGPIP